MENKRQGQGQEKRKFSKLKEDIIGRPVHQIRSAEASFVVLTEIRELLEKQNQILLNFNQDATGADKPPPVAEKGWLARVFSG